MLLLSGREKRYGDAYHMQILHQCRFLLSCSFSAETAPLAIKLCCLPATVATLGQDVAGQTTSVFPTAYGGCTADIGGKASKLIAFDRLGQVFLASYDDLFVRRCSACQRVISAEGHIPPVARVWLPAEREVDEGSWDARHPSCLQS